MRNVTPIRNRPQTGPSALATWLLFAGLFATVYFASLFTPPLMDDVDAAHAQAAQHIAENSDWISARSTASAILRNRRCLTGLCAVRFKIFGQNAFATHFRTRWPCWG